MQEENVEICPQGGTDIVRMNLLAKDSILRRYGFVILAPSIGLFGSSFSNVSVLARFFSSNAYRSKEGNGGKIPIGQYIAKPFYRREARKFQDGQKQKAINPAEFPQFFSIFFLILAYKQGTLSN